MQKQTLTGVDLPVDSTILSNVQMKVGEVSQAIGYFVPVFHLPQDAESFAEVHLRARVLALKQRHTPTRLHPASQ